MASGTIQEPLPKVFSTYKFCENAEGTMTLDVPAGTYLLFLEGKTQKFSGEFIYAAIDGVGASNYGYLGYYVPTGSGTNMKNTITMNEATFSSSHTITVSYSTNWYEMKLIALKIA